MRRAAWSPLAMLVVFSLAACMDKPPTDPLGPSDADPLDGKKGPAGCLSQGPGGQQELFDEIEADIGDLFANGGSRNAARQQLNNIGRKVCDGDAEAAFDMAFGYLGLIDEKFPDLFDGSAEDAAEHAGDIFLLAGAGGINIPAGAFDPEMGGIVVFDPDDVTLPFVASTGNNEAAVVLDVPNVFPPGTGPVTIVLSRSDGDDVVPFGAYIPGFQAFEEGYEIISSHQPWDLGPGILVAICGVPPLPDDAAIGHLHEGEVSLLVPTDPDPQDLGYIDCTTVDPTTTQEETFWTGDASAGADAEGSGGSGWVNLARRVVEPVGRLLSPPHLNAEALLVGPGLGGRTKSLSLNAPVDPVIDVDETVVLQAGFDATWSSDDESIATVEGFGDSAVVTGICPGTTFITADFGEEESLTIRITVEGEGGEECDTDVEQIAFSSFRDENLEIYVMNADGSGQTNITSDLAVDNHPTWSPGGNRIAFGSDRDGTRRIYTMNGDGTDVQGPFGAQFAIDPSWSPDGTRIAYSDSDLIHVMNVDGTNDLTLQAVSGAAFVDWSPDGTQIVARTGGQIVIVNADGSGAATAITSGFVDSYPAWSPDGTQIAFARSEPEVSGFDVYVVDVDGTNLEQLTTNQADDFAPSWSSDGSEIVFASARAGNVTLWLMNADGTDQTQLTDPGPDLDPEWQGAPPVVVD